MACAIYSIMYITNTTHNINGVLDKCINTGLSIKDSLVVLNTLFSGRVKFTKADIETRKSTYERNKVKLSGLISMPIVIQKSAEWYEIRKNLITASDFAQALGEGKFGTQKQLYKKKCGFDDDAFNPNLPPLKWGNMFEYVAQTIYSQRNSVTIHEFGIIKHPHYDFFGASPDGITENGVMLEIKCPFKRKINGEIPTQYYYQIQGQLDVCDLDECDYFECEFDDVIVTELSFKNMNGVFESGVILERPGPIYTYSEIKTVWKKGEIEQWVNKNKEEGDIIHNYRLTTCNTMRVERDHNFIKEKLEQLREIWNKVVEYRTDESLYKKEICKTSSYSRSFKIDDYVL